MAKVVPSYPNMFSDEKGNYGHEADKEFSTSEKSVNKKPFSIPWPFGRTTSKVAPETGGTKRRRRQSTKKSLKKKQKQRKTRQLKKKKNARTRK